MVVQQVEAKWSKWRLNTIPRTLHRHVEREGFKWIESSVWCSKSISFKRNERNHITNHQSGLWLKCGHYTICPPSTLVQGNNLLKSIRPLRKNVYVTKIKALCTKYFAEVYLIVTEKIWCLTQSLSL